MVLQLLITLPANILCILSHQRAKVAGSSKDGSRDCINGLAAYVRRSLSVPLFLHAAEMSRGKQRVFWQSLTSEQKEKLLFRII